jgi:hypothetical protein
MGGAWGEAEIADDGAMLGKPEAVSGFGNDHDSDFLGRICPEKLVVCRDFCVFLKIFQIISKKGLSRFCTSLFCPPVVRSAVKAAVTSRLKNEKKFVDSRVGGELQRHHNDGDSQWPSRSKVNGPGVFCPLNWVTKPDKENDPGDEFSTRFVSALFEN